MPGRQGNLRDQVVVARIERTRRNTFNTNNSKTQNKSHLTTHHPKKNGIIIFYVKSRALKNNTMVLYKRMRTKTEEGDKQPNSEQKKPTNEHTKNKKNRKTKHKNYNCSNKTAGSTRISCVYTSNSMCVYLEITAVLPGIYTYVPCTI